MAAMKQMQEVYSEHFSEVFKTITTDNSSEFADLAELEKRWLIYLSTMRIRIPLVIKVP